MKNLLRFSLCFALCLILCISGALAEFCRYGSNDSQCDIIWWVDTEARTHSRACKNHVEDKEDAFSYVVIDGPYPCSLDAGGACTVCGKNYGESGGGDDGDDDGGNVGVSWPLDTRTMLSLAAETLEIRAESFTRINAASVMIPATCVSVGASAFADSPALTFAEAQGFAFMVLPQ